MDIYIWEITKSSNLKIILYIYFYTLAPIRPARVPLEIWKCSYLTIGMELLVKEDGTFQNFINMHTWTGEHFR